MKNLSLILNAVLLVAVAVLFYLHFSSTGSKSGSSANGLPVGELSIAYINSDSVLKNYDFLKDNQVVLEGKKNKMEADFRNRAQSLQNEITSYQRNQSNLTIGQARALEEDLQKKQQNLQMYEQSLSQELMNEQNKLNKELYDRITAFLKQYGKDNGLQVVLKYDVSSDVLYGIEALDITNVVVKGLNAAYSSEKSGGTKADSTAVNK